MMLLQRTPLLLIAVSATLYCQMSVFIQVQSLAAKAERKSMETPSNLKSLVVVQCRTAEHAL